MLDRVVRGFQSRMQAPSIERERSDRMGHTGYHGHKIRQFSNCKGVEDTSGAGADSLWLLSLHLTLPGWDGFPGHSPVGCPDLDLQTDLESRCGFAVPICRKVTCCGKQSCISLKHRRKMAREASALIQENRSCNPEITEMDFFLLLPKRTKCSNQHWSV